MKAKITFLTLCVFSLSTVSCRCDFDEDEAKNRKSNQTQQNLKKK